MEDSKRILIVDDEDHIRLMIESTLEDANVDPVNLLEARDGDEALSLIRSQSPDLVITDVLMPGLDGFSLVSLVKSNPLTSHIPCIILTVLDDAPQGYRAGADVFLSKPIDHDDLLNTILNLL
ncbi:MAG: response regulator [Chloroflexi bacterium]|nr:response regulator [Chloroflexota bacterium]